jgi:hypothetical protein
MLLTKYSLGGIFCDLKKAFDCVNHIILLTKIEFYGITAKAYRTTKSYWENRHHRVL